MNVNLRERIIDTINSDSKSKNISVAINTKLLERLDAAIEKLNDQNHSNITRNKMISVGIESLVKELEEMVK